MAQSNLEHLLADINSSPTLRAAYNANKEKVWDEYGLSEADKDVLRNAKSADDIKKHLGDAYVKAQMINYW